MDCNAEIFNWLGANLNPYSPSYPYLNFVQLGDVYGSGLSGCPSTTPSVFATSFTPNVQASNLQCYGSIPPTDFGGGGWGCVVPTYLFGQNNDTLYWFQVYTDGNYVSFWTQNSAGAPVEFMQYTYSSPSITNISLSGEVVDGPTISVPDYIFSNGQYSIDMDVLEAERWMGSGWLDIGDFYAGGGPGTVICYVYYGPGYPPGPGCDSQYDSSGNYIGDAALAYCSPAGTYPYWPNRRAGFVALYGIPSSHVVWQGEQGCYASEPRPVIIGDPNPVFYDANDDGVVSAVDALCILRNIAGLSGTPVCPQEPTTPPSLLDVNDNGTIDSVDALCVLRYVVELPATSACPYRNGGPGFGAVAGQPSGAAEVSITPSDLALSSGSSANITVQANTSSLGSWTIDLTYDPTALQFTGCSGVNGSSCNVSYASNTARVSGTSASGLSGLQPVATFTVEAIGSSGSNTAISLQSQGLTDVSGDALSATVAPLTSINFVPGGGTASSANAATTADCVSTTTCTVTAPSQAAGTTDVLATVGTQTSATSKGDQFTYETASSADAVAGTAGGYNRTTRTLTVDVNGAQCDAATQSLAYGQTSFGMSIPASCGTAGQGLTFFLSGVPAAVEVPNSGGTLVQTCLALAPGATVGSAGTNDVTLDPTTTPTCGSAGSGVTVTGVSPNTGTAGSTTPSVTVTGTGFVTDTTGVTVSIQ